MLALDEQSPNIAAGVHINRSIEDLGAGDQVIGNRLHPLHIHTPLSLIINHYAFVSLISYCESNL